MEKSINTTSTRIAVVPLTPRQTNEDMQWLGIMLAKLLGEHLSGAGLMVLPSEHVTQQIRTDKHRLPLNLQSAEQTRTVLKADALLHGGYVLDEDSKMLGINLIVEAPAIPRTPLEVAAPLAGFGRFIERISLAVIDHLGMTITDRIRERIHDVPRPASFNAYRQLARAYAAWSRDQNELALTALSSARTLDPDFEEIAALQVAIARTADDVDTAREAFMRWMEMAKGQKKLVDAGERLMQLGHWLVERGEWIEARKTYDEARKHFHDAKYERGVMQAVNNQANLDLVRGKFQDAIQTYRRSLRTFEEDPNGQDDIATTYYNLSLAHKNLGQREEALRALDEASAHARRQKDARLEAMCQAQRGALYDDAGEWGQARTAYEKAIRLLDVVGDERGRGMVKTHQAMLFKQQGSYDRAEAILKESAALLDQYGDPHSQAILAMNIADLYLSMENYEQAWELAERAHDIFVDMKSEWQSITQELLDILGDLLPEEEAEEVDEETEEADTTEDENDLFPPQFGQTDLPASTKPRAASPPTNSSIPPRPFGGASSFSSADSSDDEMGDK